MSALGAIGAISGAADLAYGHYQNRQMQSMTKQQMRWQSKEAEKNREWQEQMSNTAYQRSAADLEQAGLNRVLALGSPSSTPGGSMPSGPGVPSLNKLSSTEKMLQQAQVQTAKHQARLVGAQADKAAVTTALYKEAFPFIKEALESGNKWLGDPKDIMSSVKDNSAKAVKNWKRGVKEIYKDLKDLAPRELRELIDLNKQKRDSVDVLLPGLDY
jgi:hypothetical protein